MTTCWAGVTRVGPLPSPGRPLSLTASDPHLSPGSHSTPHTEPPALLESSLNETLVTELVSLLGTQGAGLSPLSTPRTYKCPAHKRHLRKISDSESQGESQVPSVTWEEQVSPPRLMKR